MLLKGHLVVQQMDFPPSWRAWANKQLFPACIDRASVLSAHVELLQPATVDGLPVFIQQTLCELSLSHPFAYETLIDSA